MDVGTASIAINKLMGIVSVVAGGKTPESISGALSNNPFNVNQDLNKQLNLAKLNSLISIELKQALRYHQHFLNTFQNDFY